MYTYNQKLSHLFELVRLSEISTTRKDVEDAFIGKVAEYLKVDLSDLNGLNSKNHKSELPDSENKLSLIHI